MHSHDDALKHLTPDERLRSFVFTDPRQADNPIVFVNEVFLQLTGYDRGEVLGANCRFLQGTDTNPDTVQSIRDALAQVEPITADILNYRKDGSPFWNRLRIRPVIAGSGTLVNFVGIQNPIDVDQVRPEPVFGIAE